MPKPTVKIVRTLKELRRISGAWRQEGATTALVPTMGALHDGHLGLVKLARRKADHAVVSIFVNPTQFAAHEDLSRYPRDEAGDVAKLASVGADLVWSPTPQEMYPEGFATRVVPEGAALGLEGEFRPHHFGGVATVCCKLFSQVTPDFACFGEKDYQQLCVIRQMVRDLSLPLKILALPTVRETDGLAMSSRNAYLTAEQRRIAPQLNAALRKLAAAAAAGAPIRKSATAVVEKLQRSGFDKIDYIEVRDGETLAPYDRARSRSGRVLGAAWLGRTRLIDNVEI
jgi:pantoate--beta-alanine ligase